MYYATNSAFIVAGLIVVRCIILKMTTTTTVNLLIIILLIITADNDSDITIMNDNNDNENRKGSKSWLKWKYLQERFNEMITQIEKRWYG